MPAFPEVIFETDHGDVALRHVRYRNKSGKHMLISSFSQADPKRSFKTALIAWTW
jgi:hypothetical protein